MTVQRHGRPHPHIERTFTAVRAALPAGNVAAFDTELEAITHAPIVDLAALDEFLSGWLRIATRAAADPADWQRMHQEAEQLQSGARSAGPTLAEGAGPAWGPAVAAYTIRMGSDVAEAQIDGLSDAGIDVLLEIYEVLRLIPNNGRKLGPAATCTSGTTRAPR